MNGKLKSAYELALEKLEKEDPSITRDPLSEEQKQKIAEIRKTFQARIAERRIMMESEMRKAVQSYPTEQQLRIREQVEQKYKGEIRHLEAEMEEAARKVREN